MRKLTFHSPHVNNKSRGHVIFHNLMRIFDFDPNTKTYLYNFDPLKPHFYKVKLGFTGVYINFLISAQNIDCGYSLEPPRRGGSVEYPQSIFWAEIEKKISEFLSEIFLVLVVKFSIYLNKRIFVMTDFRYLRQRLTKSTNGMCAHPWLRSTWESAQSDQSLRCALNG